MSFSSPASLENEIEECGSLRSYEDIDVEIPEGYHHCFEDYYEPDRVAQTQETVRINSSTQDNNINTLDKNDSPLGKENEPPRIEGRGEDSPKALAILKPNRDEEKPGHQQVLEGFAISKEIVLTSTEKQPLY